MKGYISLIQTPYIPIVEARGITAFVDKNESAGNENDNN